MLASLPFAVWLFLAIEQLPLAAEESVDPKRDMPKGIILGMVTLIVSAFMIVLAQPVGRGRRLASRSAPRCEPLLDGFRAIYGDIGVTVLAFVGADRPDRQLPHDHLSRRAGRSIRCRAPAISRRGLSVTHRDLQDAACRDDRRRRRRARRHADHLVRRGARTQGGAIIGGMLLNMAVFGAMFSYILQAVSFILLRQNQPHIERPYVSPLGIPGAVVTIVIGVVTLLYQLQDPNFYQGRHRGCWSGSPSASSISRWSAGTS